MSRRPSDPPPLDRPSDGLGVGHVQAQADGPAAGGGDRRFGVAGRQEVRHRDVGAASRESHCGRATDPPGTPRHQRDLAAKVDRTARPGTGHGPVLPRRCERPGGESESGHERRQRSRSSDDAWRHRRATAFWASQRSIGASSAWPTASSARASAEVRSSPSAKRLEDAPESRPIARETSSAPSPREIPSERPSARTSRSRCVGPVTGPAVGEGDKLFPRRSPEKATGHVGEI